MPSETGHNLGRSNNNVIYNTPYGIGQPGSIVYGGGGGIPSPAFRNEDDERRSMYRRTPAAEYPNGYLGTITSRREDRLLDALKNRVNERSYQRGVHKGERIDPADYFWPAEFGPMNGLRAERDGHRQFPVYALAVIPNPSESILPGPGQNVETSMDPKRQQQLRRLRPMTRW